jgi:hypothetical protein
MNTDEINSDTEKILKKLDESFVGLLPPDFEDDFPEGTLNAVDALLIVAREIRRLARAIGRLGLNGASTEMGALEVVSLEIKKGFDSVSNTLREIKQE